MFIGIGRMLWASGARRRRQAAAHLVVLPDHPDHTGGDMARIDVRARPRDAVRRLGGGQGHVGATSAYTSWRGEQPDGDPPHDRSTGRARSDATPRVGKSRVVVTTSTRRAATCAA